MAAPLLHLLAVDSLDVLNPRNSFVSKKKSIPDVTIKMVCFDLRQEDLWVYAECCVMLQRSRAKDDEIFYMRHDGGCMIRCGAKLVRAEKGIPRKPMVRTVLSSRETSVAERCTRKSSGNSEAKTIPKNPTSGKQQEHEESGHAVYRNWCAVTANMILRRGSAR